jgi:phosphoenolpyruvate synthase/pyruvate phosphate dikinase
MAEQFIFPFTFGDRTQSDLLGGKGANLAEMVKIGLPVPPGFTITTKACQEFLKSGHSPATLPAELNAAMTALEKELDKEFGNPLTPLILSVRSGAKFSMPGIENFAPDHTERISGFNGLPNSLSSSFSSADIAASNSAGSVSGEWPLFKNS